MTIETFLQRVDLFVLVFTRMIGLFVTSPIWSNPYVPVQLRVALALVLGLLVLPLVGTPELPSRIIELAPLVVKELLVGLIIGFIATVIFAAIHLAGELLDIDMGLSLMNVLDPLTGAQVPLVGNFKYLLALLVFLAIGGHHTLLIGVVQSYLVIPVGGVTVGPAVTEAMMDIASGVFLAALRIAAPVMGALLLTTVALGVVNRAVPQMNVFIVGLPVKLGVGVFMLAVGIPLYVGFLEVLFDSLGGELSRVLLLLRG
jgi:flagellar biosynthesis protein FliR